jgi:uncharacterized membrane protein
MRWIFASPLKVEHDRVTAAIVAAEARTSGRIRVLVARHRAPQAVAAAQAHFQGLGIARLPLRNGVLIFVSPRSRTFAVIGDQGVHEKCGDGFWRELTAAMTGYFKKGDFTGGLVHGIGRAGALLAEHFPAEAGPAAAPTDAVEDVD